MFVGCDIIIKNLRNLFEYYPHLLPLNLIVGRYFKEKLSGGLVYGGGLVYFKIGMFWVVWGVLMCLLIDVD